MDVEIILNTQASVPVTGQMVAMSIVPGGSPALPPTPPPTEADPTEGWGLIGYTDWVP